ncbi:MAG: DUF4870 domain-containing protein [Candidatus Sumerlaeia bacterium]
MSIADEIEKLNNLKNSGAISDEEFQEAKRKLLQRDPTAGEIFDKAVGAVDEKMWAMMIHLGLLCGYFLPLLGLIVPILIWQIKKGDSAFIDANGKVVANWILTALILGALFFILKFILIGFPLMIVLLVVTVIYAIIGGIKAYNGEIWPYPGSFKFFH